MGVTPAIAALTFGWGIAEATLFFIVPDVLLTLLVARGVDVRPALICAVIAAVGAVVGGAIMLAWGARPATEVFARLDAVPAISANMISEIRTEMTCPGWGWDMVNGAYSGEPYKVFAAAAGTAGLGWAPFLALSFAARLSRFALVVIVAFAIRHVLLRLDAGAWTVPAAISFWLAFYIVFFSVMPN